MFDSIPEWPDRAYSDGHQHKESEAMQTQTFTQEEIADYLDDLPATDEHELGLIMTCVRIIGKYEPSVEDRNVEMVEAATQSLMDWMGEYGVGVKGWEVIENQV